MAPPPFGATVPSLLPGAQAQTYGDRDRFDWGMTIHGPIAGLKITF